MNTSPLKRILSIILTVALVFSMSGMTALAEDGISIGTSSLLDCHTTHDETCGYTETVTEGDCTHEHTDDCGYTEDTEEQPCNFIPDEDAEHSHDDTCGYASATEDSPCTHEHGDCGYGESITVDSPCTHSCEVCKPGDKPAEKVCTCPPVDSGELVHGKDCPLYTAPEPSEAVNALIAMADALPNAADITVENKKAAKTYVETAQAAYEALSDEDKAAFEATEQYKKLMALTAMMANRDDEPLVMICICPLEGGSSIHTDNNCPFYALQAPIPKGRSAGTVPEGITVTQKGDNAWNIYANGNPIIIKAGKTDPNYSFIYIDTNENGVVDQDENTPVELTGVYLAQGYGYFLINSSIFGGCETADLTGDTSVTMESGKARILCGGGFTGDVDGTVNVTAKDKAEPSYIHGAASGNTGDVNLNISGSSRVYRTVFGGAMSGGTVGNTNIYISGNAWLNYVYGGAENGTTGDTNITIDSKNDGGDIKVKYVSGGGNGSGEGAIAVSGDSTITVNKNVFYSGNANNDFKDMEGGGWIYGGGFAAISTTGSSTINLSYDDAGEYFSYPMVCGAGNMGSITGNSIINVKKNAPSWIYCGGYSGNVNGTTNVNVSAANNNGNHYRIFGFKGDENPNDGGESTVTYTNIGAINNPTWVDPAVGVNNIILYKAIVLINNDNTSPPICDNLVVGADSSLSMWVLPFTVTKNFTGGGSIISEHGAFLSVGGEVSGMTTLNFERSSNPGSNTEIKIVSAANATAENFKLADSRSDYTLIKSGNDWKAVRTTAIPLNIQTSGTLTYGETMQVKVTAADNVTTNGKVKLEARATEDPVTLVFSAEKNLTENKNVTFSIPLNEAAGAYQITASFKEGSAIGQAQTSVTVARRSLTISGVKIPPKEYGINTEVKIPFSSFENATLEGYLDGDSGAVLFESDYYAQLDSSDLDVGENKKIIFAPNAIFRLRRNTQAEKSMYNKYYVPAPDNLTIDIVKQVLHNYALPVPIGSIGLGQSLKDVNLQTTSTLFDYNWQDPTTKPQIGNQTGYPIICTIKKEHAKNYEFDPQIPGYDASRQCVVISVIISVVERPDLNSIDTAIIGAKNAKNGIMTDERAESLVEKGAKFVTAAEMQALDDAIKTAEAAKITVNTTAEAEAVASVLGSAVAKFKAAIKTGTYTSSVGGGGSGGDTPSTPSTPIITETLPNMPQAATAVITCTVKDGVLTATITEKMAKDAIAAAKTNVNGVAVQFNLTASGNYGSISATIDRAALEALKTAGVKYVKIGSAVIDLTLDNKTIAGILAQTTGNITVSATKQSKLSNSAKALIGNRPVFDITIKDAGVKSVSDLKGGTATIGIAYKPTSAEKTGNLYGVYVDSKGKPQLLVSSSYENGKVIFSRNSLSVYGIGYKTPVPTFTDTTKHWAKDNIDFVASRGLIAGTTATTFAPDVAITRATFLMALGKFSGADVSGYKKSSFTDVKDTDPAMPYIEWAVKNKITEGIGGGKFGSDQKITREQMAVMMVNYAKATGYKLPVSRTAVTFADNAKISAYAKDAVKAIQQTGVISGKPNNLFDPQGKATRAEGATILRRFMVLVIDESTARGWVQNDAGQWQYIDTNGKMKTGKVPVGGKTYYFNSDGTLAINKKDGDIKTDKDGVIIP